MPSHAPTIAKWFHLPHPLPIPPSPNLPISPLPRPGQILLLTGPSGSGKSTLLRHLHTTAIQHHHRALDFTSLPLPDRPTIDTLSLPLNESLHLLSLVGLAEAHTYLLPPRALSEGQRARLRLALALSRTTTLPSSLATGNSQLATTLFCDEFAACLDRITALTLSRSLRRLTRHPAYAHLSFALATSHPDLPPALAPDLTLHCDFGTHSLSPPPP